MRIVEVDGIYLDSNAVEAVTPSDAYLTGASPKEASYVLLKSGLKLLVLGSPRDVARKMWCGDAPTQAQLFLNEAE